jgi:hypothetical protein
LLVLSELQGGAALMPPAPPLNALTKLGEARCVNFRQAERASFPAIEDASIVNRGDKTMADCVICVDLSKHQTRFNFQRFGGTRVLEDI